MNRTNSAQSLAALLSMLVFSAAGTAQQLLPPQNTGQLQQQPAPYYAQPTQQPAPYSTQPTQQQGVYYAQPPNIGRTAQQPVPYYPQAPQQPAPNAQAPIYAQVPQLPAPNNAQQQPAQNNAPAASATPDQSQKGLDAQLQPLEPWMPDFLRQLPHPPVEPTSLHTPGLPPGSDYACPPLSDQPYLVKEPLIDLPGFPQCGWYGAAQVEGVGVHIVDRLFGTVTAGGRGADTVGLEPRGLDPTVSPLAEIGYRLPSGFGGFSLNFRTLSTQGSFTNVGAMSSTQAGYGGLASTQSRLTFTTADLDYESWEFTPADSWTMRWRFGGRLAYLYYDVLQNQSPGSPATGSGIIQQRATDMFSGFGPHATLELTHRLWLPEWSILGKVDVASLFGRIKQDTSETAYNPAGGLAWGESPLSSSQTTPYVSGLFGVNWKPSQNIDFSFGYQFEQWWNVGRLSLEQGYDRSRGDMTLNGIVIRFQYNY